MASIWERNGKFCVIYHYTDPDGKRKSKWETYRTKSEAVRRRKEIEKMEQNGPIKATSCVVFRELLTEYVELYGKDKWALSTYDSNQALIRNYILPLIGGVKIADINTHFLERFYRKLLSMPPVVHPVNGKPPREHIGTSTIRDIHKLIRSCFEQAVKWELIDKNPATHATVPKHKQKEREVWTVETLRKALNVCEDRQLALAMNLSYAATLRIGELLGLTWDCVDISEDAIRQDRAKVLINKEIQRVSKESLHQLQEKDIVLIFPEESPLCKTVRVLKAPKTESSVRHVYLPRSVAELLKKQKEEQEELKELLGREYHDYNLVMATSFGMPLGMGAIRKKFMKLIKDNDLPEVVFHSLRHCSVSSKLRLSGGNIKAVQGDSGHAQASMVTDVYSHIDDEDRRRTAQMLEETFYRGQTGNADSFEEKKDRLQAVAEESGVDVELLMKALENPETRMLLSALIKHG